MKFAVDKSLAGDVLALQKTFDVTIISNKGLVFMHRDAWQRICSMLAECSDVLVKSLKGNTLSHRFSFWSACFIVACDKSDDYSCHAICDFDFFALCCRECNIHPVLLPMYDLIYYIKAFDAHHNGEVLGGYRESGSGIIIEVEE